MSVWGLTTCLLPGRASAEQLQFLSHWSLRRLGCWKLFFDIVGGQWLKQSSDVRTTKVPGDLLLVAECRLVGQVVVNICRIAHVQCAMSSCRPPTGSASHSGNRRTSSNYYSLSLFINISTKDTCMNRIHSCVAQPDAAGLYMNQVVFMEHAQVNSTDLMLLMIFELD